MNSAQPPPLSSFRDFWPFYLGEHRKPGTRAIHLAGTASAVLLMAVALLSGAWWLIIAALAPGYGLAWLSHWLVERNRPATFRHPLWSFRGDLRMLVLWLAGRLDAEYDRHGIR